MKQALLLMLSVLFKLQDISKTLQMTCIVLLNHYSGSPFKVI